MSRLPYCQMIKLAACAQAAAANRKAPRDRHPLPAGCLLPQKRQELLMTMPATAGAGEAATGRAVRSRVGEREEGRALQVGRERAAARWCLCSAAMQGAAIWCISQYLCEQALGSRHRAGAPNRGCSYLSRPSGACNSDQKPAQGAVLPTAAQCSARRPAGPLGGCSMRMACSVCGRQRARACRRRLAGRLRLPLPLAPAGVCLRAALNHCSLVKHVLSLAGNHSTQHDTP